MINPVRDELYVQRRILDRPSNEMTVNDIVDVVQLVMTNDARSAKVDAIDLKLTPTDTP